MDLCGMVSSWRRTLLISEKDRVKDCSSEAEKELYRIGESRKRKSWSSW